MKITDQTGQTIIIPSPVTKIISVVPSQTELLYDLGLNDEITGITKFCIHPNEWFKTKTRVGGTKTLNLELIKKLNPDIIIANKEENTEAQIKTLCRQFPVYISDIKNLADAYEMMEAVGNLTGKEEKVNLLISKIKNGFDELKPAKKINAAYLIWQQPYMAAGSDTFINDMMKRCGIINVLQNKQRYPETTIEELNTHNCKVLLLSSEPFPFKQKQADEIKAAGFKGKITLVDGEMFSWYGSRLLKAANYFKELIQSL